MFKNENNSGCDDGREKTEILVVKELEKRSTALNKFQISRFKSNVNPIQRESDTVC